MVFASFLFLFWFLPAFLPVYFALPLRWRNLWLTVGSFVFYGWWRPQYVVLMLASTLLDFVAVWGRCFGAGNADASGSHILICRL